mmetsp:Transcript_17179/g.22304  ORF Transcript_17179/g.22304 Transcript_17179/m.22304 type:complete len:632 (+) Transcript_17179:194-2089(+)
MDLDYQYVLNLLIIVVLVLMSALFSGLTLGLMALDMTGLEVVCSNDEDTIAAEKAKKIMPIREDGNRLLCTLLLGNVAVNALLSILLADLTSGLLGFLVSTIIIVIFGEITPQALCSRHALTIGSRVTGLVKFIMLIFYPVSKPLGMILDFCLGRELGTVYTKHEMENLIDIHMNKFGFDKETGRTMTGALRYQDILVADKMTPISEVFMLSIDEKLSFTLIANIFKSGYSRIPVYEISRDQVVGLLFVKDLIFIDPNDETPLRQFIEIFGRGLHVVWPDMKLGKVLTKLKQGRSHMALVRDVNNESDSTDPYYEVKGIITLEDIIEVILQDEIVDETDVFLHVGDKETMDRSKFDFSRLRMLDSKFVDEKLSREEVNAVCAHFETNHKLAVSSLSRHQLRSLISSTTVTQFEVAEQDIDEEIPSELLYHKGTSSQICTLVLSGKVTVFAGQDQFRSDVGAWSVLGAQTLTDSSYIPDYTAFVSGGPCRCLQISREDLLVASDTIIRNGDTGKGKCEDQSMIMPGKSVHSKELSRSKIIMSELERLGENKHSKAGESKSDQTTLNDEDVEMGIYHMNEDMDELKRELTNGGQYQVRPKRKTSISDRDEADHNHFYKDSDDGITFFVAPPST